jgi:hypothetical protein
MTAPGITGRVRPAQPRRLHLVMRDATMIEGNIQIGEDQTLVHYFNSRRGGWMSLTNARRPKTEEPGGHMIVQSDQIIMASAPDANIQVMASPGSGTEERAIEVVLIGGKTLRGHIAAAKQQRLSDYVASSGRFIGLTRASLMPDDRPLGDVALHSGAVVIFRDLLASAPLDDGSSIQDSSGAA